MAVQKYTEMKVDPVEWVLDLTDGIGADCVIEAVGHYQLPEGQEAPLAQAVKMIRSGGRIVTTGLGEQLLVDREDAATIKIVLETSFHTAVGLTRRVY